MSRTGVEVKRKSPAGDLPLRFAASVLAHPLDRAAFQWRHWTVKKNSFFLGFSYCRRHGIYRRRIPGATSRATPPPPPLSLTTGDFGPTPYSIWTSPGRPIPGLAYPSPHSGGNFLFSSAVTGHRPVARGRRTSFNFLDGFSPADR